MFRHFAAATVVITLLLALFANGEAQDVGEKLATQHQFAEANAKAMGKRELKFDVGSNAKAHKVGRLGRDGNGTAAVPVDDSPVGGGDLAWNDGSGDITPFARGSGAGPGAVSPTVAGSVLHAEDFAEGAPVPGAPGSAPPNRAGARKKSRPSQQEIDRLIADSRARSGNAGSD